MRDPFGPMTQGEIDRVSAWVYNQRLKRDVRDAVGGVLFNVSNFPREAQTRLLGRDMAPLRDKITDAVLDALGIKVLA